MVRLVCFSWLLVDRSKTRLIIDAVSGGSAGVGWSDQGVLMILPVGAARLRAWFYPLESLDALDCMPLVALPCFGLVFCRWLF
ncbi:hypothetical protein RB2150_11431 [Rhodobacteraceae bacterium HTCC2150]|nr:hypothetical protein RB2150_11431 [Rhodobacteraceae bacterium HTCC2150]